MKPFADSIETDVHGNVMVALNPQGSPRVMLAGHADQIGVMITYISDEGFVFCCFNVARTGTPNIVAHRGRI